MTPLTKEDEVYLINNNLPALGSIEGNNEQCAKDSGCKK